MSLNLNDIDLELFLEYFNDSLLDDVQSKVVEIPVEVKGNIYEISFDNNDKIHYLSPVPLKNIDPSENNLDHALVDYLRYNYFPKTGESDIIYNMGDITEIEAVDTMKEAKQLYFAEYFHKPYLKIPTYSEYSLYINKSFNRNMNFNTNMAITNEDEYSIKIPLLEIYETNENTEPIHQNEIVIENHLDPLKISGVKFYNIETVFETPHSSIVGYIGSVNLKRYLFEKFTDENDGLYTESELEHIGWSNFETEYLFMDNHAGRGNPQIDDALSTWVKVKINKVGVTLPIIYVHIGYMTFNKKIMMPKMNLENKPLFQDKYGIESTLPTQSTNFMNHNRSIQENAFHIAPDIDAATFNFASNIIGMRQLGQEYFFTITHRFKKTIEWKKIEGIPTESPLRTIVNPEITKKLEEKDEFKIEKVERFTENVLNITRFPRYAVFNDEQNNIIAEKDKKNIFYVLDEIRDYKVGDVVLLECLDNSTQTRSVLMTYFAKISKIESLFIENDVIHCEPPTMEIDDPNTDISLPIVDLEYYLKKSNQLNDMFVKKSDGKFEKQIEYQNSLDLSKYYEYIETWEYLNDDPLMGYDSEVIPGVKYSQLEFYKYNHSIIKKTDDTPSNIDGNIIFYNRNYLGENYNIYRLNKPIQPNCLTIDELVEKFNKSLHFAKDGYLENRGEPLSEQSSIELDNVIFSEMLSDKLNTLDEIGVIPEISNSDPKKLIKMKLISEAIVEYTNSLEMPVSGKTTIKVAPELLFEPKDILLIKSDEVKALKQKYYKKNKKLKAIVSGFNKNVFQRIHGYKNYKTLKERVDEAQNLYETKAIIDEYDSIKTVRNDPIKKPPVKKTQPVLDIYYEKIINAVSQSFVNDAYMDDLEYLNDKDYEAIEKFKHVPIISNVEEKMFLSKDSKDLSKKIMAKELLKNEDWSHIELNDFILWSEGEK